jgi:DNA-binding response OmpR family regulator
MSQKISQRLRVLLVEDDLAVSEAINIAFRSEGFEVRVEADGTSLSMVAEQFHPDIAILDVRLPVGPDGYEMARTLRDKGDLPVLLLTAADSLEDRLRGFDSGADDHLAKPFSTAELLARSQALLRRAGKLTPAVLQLADLVVDDATRTVTRGGQAVELTRTEYDLLSVLLRHVGRILSKQQILVNVWGFDAFDPNIVEAHMSALRRKLEAHGPRMIHTVRSVGYLIRD